jgi:hypothetical protein
MVTGKRVTAAGDGVATSRSSSWDRAVPVRSDCNARVSDKLGLLTRRSLEADYQLRSRCPPEWRTFCV